MSSKLRPSELSFETVCDFLEAISLDNLSGVPKKFERRLKYINKFIRENIDRPSGEAFDVFRLILPQLDTERGNYNLKEANLGAAYIQALGMDRSDPSANALIKWKDPGTVGSGNLSAIVENILHKYARIKNDDPREDRTRLKVGTVNEKLDELVRASGNRQEQAGILGYFSRNATPRQCKWLTQIILKNMKHKCGEGTLFNAWHPDAQSYYDSHGMSLRAVFNELTDQEIPSMSDIVPGKVVNPQLAATTLSSKLAIEKLHIYLKKKYGAEGAEGRKLSFVIEHKFDGERIQVHRTENTIQYFSRRAIEHGEKSNYTVMDEVILAATGGKISEEELQQAEAEAVAGKKKNGAGSKLDCVLDGELIVWNKRRQSFEPFGTLKNTINLAQAGRPPDTLVIVGEYGEVIDNSLDTAAEFETATDGGASATNNEGGNNTSSFTAPRLGDLEIMYIPFDVLYCNQSAKIKLPLSERHRLLKETVHPTSLPVPGISGICARVEPLIPEETRFGGHLASRKASTEAEISLALENVRQRKEEGIVIKSLDSQWIPSDRGKHWLKIKPDYLFKMDIDAVVLGGWYAKSGGRSCVGITQYLMGLPQAPSRQGEQPTKFLTFCRVGSGLDENERQLVNNQLMPLFVADPYAKPSCVIARDTITSRPDVWVKDPFKSVVLTLNADLRFIASDNYASRVSLRFPRIERIRDDKDACSANHEDTLLQVAHEKLNELAEADAKGTSKAGAKKRRKSGVGGGSKRRKVGQVLEHVRKQAEKLAAVEANSDIFKTRKIFIFPPPPGFKSSIKGNLTSWRVKVKQLGGLPPANYLPSVTDVVAATLNDEKVQIFIKKNPDKSILSPGWIVRCQESNMLCPLRPRDFLYMAPGDDRKPSPPEADQFGDFFYEDAEVEDVEALVQHHIKAEDLSVDEIIRSLRAAAAPLLLLTEGEKQHRRYSPAGTSSAAAALSANGDPSSSSLVFANGLTSLNALDEYASRAETHQTHPSGRTLLGFLDSELAAVGKLDFRRSLLHGCTLFILDIPIISAGDGGDKGNIKKEEEIDEEEKKNSIFLPGTKDVEIETTDRMAAARRLRSARLRMTAQLLGAKVVSELTPEVTHLVGIITTTATGMDTNITTATAAADDAVLGPDTDTLLATIKASSPEGSKGVHVLRQSLLYSKSIQLVTSDWIEEAAALAAAATAEEKTEEKASLPQPPDAAQFPLMDAALIDDESSWQWSKYSPVRRPVSATDRGGERRQGRHRARAKGVPAASDNAPYPGEIIKVPGTRRGTAIKRGKANSRAKTVHQIKEEEEEEDGSEGGGGGGHGAESEFDLEDEIGSVADFELVNVPKVIGKPRGNAGKMKKTTATEPKAPKMKKKKEEKNAADLATLPPPSAPVSASIPAPAPMDDEPIMSMKDFLSMMPLDDKKKGAPAASTALAGAASAASPAGGNGVGSSGGGAIPTAHPITNEPNYPGLPASTAVAPPSTAAPTAAAADGGGGAARPKLSLKDKIRQIKEAKERAEAGGNP